MRRHAIILTVLLLGLASALSYAQAPVPLINLPLVPDATAPGGPQFTLTVNGTGFVSSSVVNWNGVPLATQFVSGSRLTATVPAANIATANTGWVTVVNPAPGGGASNTTFFTVPSNNEGNSLAFILSSAPSVGTHPVAVAVGDFNGDGKMDLAVANAYSNTASILLGDGTGNFTLASSPATQVWPDSVGVGDFNGDGKLDLAVLNMCGIFSNCYDPWGTVSVLLGDGTGNFTLASEPTTWDPSYSLAVGDFNGDGKLDLAVVTVFAPENEGRVRILLGDGTGNFNLVGLFPTGSGSNSVATGDFNGDGKLDLAVTNSSDNTVSILLGDGAGNFTLTSSPPVGSSPSSVAVGDFNGDGKLDLAVANSGNSTVSILLGDGTGNFTLASSPSVGSGPSSVAVGDFNGDSKLDLAVANSASNTVSILLGDGTGNFAPAWSPPVSYPAAVAVADFNGDGKLDLAVTNVWDNTVTILLQVPPYPIATLSPAWGLTFAPQRIGTKSSPQTVTLTNTGSAPLAITSIVASAGFGQNNNCGSSLSLGASCTINVIFRPGTTGTVPGTVTITDNATGSPQTVSLAGVGTAVSLSPTSLSFSDQFVGTTSPPQTVTLTNYATRPVAIMGVGIAGGENFLQSNNCGTSVPGGATCTISVTFAPRSGQSFSETLEVADNGGASPQTVSLSGNGVLPVTLSPANLVFATQVVGTQSSPQYVTVTNASGAILNITSIVTSANFIQTNDCGSSVGVDGGCTITVTFAPQESGNLNGLITITDSAPNSPQRVPMTGVATAITLSPSSLDFGGQPVGTTSPPQIVTLTNVGSKTVAILRVGIGGEKFAQTNDCGTVVLAGGTCSINVTFTPTGVRGYSGTLAVYDTGGASPQTVPLSGSGTP